ncbi:MAG: hypothetical protein KGL39_53035 [Patescibacteria group bacterium]|nr:hypothetical protein [Patescibacteria group bacterium]
MERLILWKLAAVAFFVGAYFLIRRSWLADFAAVFLIALALNHIAIHHVAVRP